MSYRKLWFGLAIGAALSSNLARAQDPPPTTDQKIQQLQQKVEELEKEVKADETVEPGQNAAVTTADYANGFTIKSKDGNFVLHIGADVQVDNHTFAGTGSGSYIDNIVLRRVRPTLYGTVYKYVDYFIRPDFGLGTTALYDAYVQLNYIPWFQVRAGKFKPPVGLERLQDDDDTSFVERGLPTLLVPQRDIGYPDWRGSCSSPAHLSDRRIQRRARQLDRHGHRGQQSSRLCGAPVSDSLPA